MARPQKEGLEYFPIVTSFDDKINLIITEFGPSGLGIIIGLFQKIYTNSYYMDWNEDILMLFAVKHINAEKELVREVINKCLIRNIFNNDLFKKYSILTSRGIQRQYLKVCKDCRRKNVEFISEFCLLRNNEENYRVITALTPLNAEETPVNDVQSTQRKEKVKESKVKESKEINVEENTQEFLSQNNKSLELCIYYEKLKPGQPIGKDIGTLNIWLEMYSYEWVKEAIEMCVMNKGKFIIPWIEKVLKNWTAEGKEESHGSSRADSKSDNRELKIKGNTEIPDLGDLKGEFGEV